MNQKTPSPSHRPCVLTIAGFDPTSGAGVLADVGVIRALGCHPMAALTSLSAQNSRGVAQILPLNRSMMNRELAVVSHDFRPSAIKIGMIYSPAAVRVVASFLTRTKIPAVLDPVLRSTSGGSLVQLYAIPLLQNRLMPLCRLVTPNLFEASYFLEREVNTLQEFERAARELSARWGTAVLLKGGHLPGEPVDVLVEGDRAEYFPHQRTAASMNLRGTGCALSSAAAVGLAKGMSLRDAVRFALDYIQEAISRNYLSCEGDGIGYLDFPVRPA